VVRPYPGRITLLRPTEVPVDVGPTPPDRGWGRLADIVDVSFVPGQHHTMVNEPHVRVLAERLRACLQIESGRQKTPRETQPVR
jgi:thioesterase domain-containing protein